MKELQKRPTFICRLESSESLDFWLCSSCRSLHTHSWNTHTLQVSGTTFKWLHKAKRGEKSRAKKATAGVITLLRKKLTMKTVGVEEGEESIKEL